MFEIFVSVTVENEDQIYRRSGCGIVIIANTTPKYKRSYYYGLGSSDRSLALSKAIKIALSSIKSKFRNEKTVLNISDSVFSTEDAPADLKTWMSYYADLEIINDSKHQTMEEALELSRKGCEEQSIYDSKELHYEVS